MYVHTYTCVYMCIHIYIYIYIERERDIHTCTDRKAIASATPSTRLD